MGRKRPKRGSCLGTRGHASFKDIKKIFWYFAKGRPALTYLCEIFYFAHDGRDSGNSEHYTQNRQFSGSHFGGLWPQIPSTHGLIKLRITFRDTYSTICHTKKIWATCRFFGRVFAIIVEKCRKKSGQLWGAIFEKWAKIWKFVPLHAKWELFLENQVNKTDWSTPYVLRSSLHRNRPPKIREIT